MENLINELIDFRKGDCQEIIKTLPDGSIDVILTDPPYLYLKGQKLEREFDEDLFFRECKRVLKKTGFIVLFGRGTSFYRWNTKLSELGFIFKEEIVWDKSYSSSPVTPITRVHETISIHSKGSGVIKNVKVPYVKSKFNSIDSIAQDLKRIKQGLNNPKELDALEKYIKDKKVDFGKDKVMGNNVTVQGVIRESCRSVNTLKSINDGMKEKSIILEKRDHYDTIHPTQKPIGILKRLLALVLPEYEKNADYSLKPKVADFFSGSGSTGEACIELDIPFFGCEIDDEYYESSKDRLLKVFNSRNRQVSLF